MRIPEFPEQGIAGRLAQWLLVDNDPQWLFGLLRNFWPIARVGKWAFVSRYDDVEEVLLQDKVFEVPFGPNVEELNGGPNFLLGMSDGDEYRRFRREVMGAFTLADITEHVVPQSVRFTRACVPEGKGVAFDAVEGMITRVPTEIASDYYGLEIPPDMKTAFGRWSIVMSTFLFGNPGDDPVLRKSALKFGAKLRELIDARIGAAIETGNAKGVLGRLIKTKITGSKDSDQKARKEILAFLIGMVTGFVPTNTMAAGHMLEVLLSDNKMMEQTRAAALSGDDERLKRCLFEAMRFKPLNPGPFRRSTHDYVLGEGGARSTLIPKGTMLVAGTQSAMFDDRRVINPYAFNPDRPRSDFMLFGRGLHWCVGAFIAEAQITQMFKVLLKAGLPRRAKGKRGKLSRLGPFPWHLFIELT